MSGTLGSTYPRSRLTSALDQAQRQVGVLGAEDLSRSTPCAEYDAWSADTALDTSHTLPWGTMTGREFIDAYAHEFTVHAWDLARVTGRVNDLDPLLAEAALAWYARNVPAEMRSDDGPFGPVVEVADDADAYTRLAAYVGRPGKG